MVASTLSKTQSSAVTGVPGLSALPGFQSEGWQVLVAPVGTPGAIVNKVNADLIKALSFDDVKKRLADLGREDTPMSPEETLAFIQHEQATWSPILAAIGPIK